MALLASVVALGFPAHVNSAITAVVLAYWATMLKALGKVKKLAALKVVALGI